MSDIYLQISETPTVVTLSAPVISGALSSTVTVANTVTVALDSNSLSALENVTVTVGAAITGTVTVSNFPSSQAVTFSAVSISNFPSTQTIAGTVTANVSTFGAFGGTLLDYNGANTVLNVGIQKIGNTSLNSAAFFPVEVYIASNPISASNPVPSRILIGTGSGSAVSAGNPMPISGSVTASISGTVPVSGTFYQATQPVSLASVPAHAVTLTSTTVTVSSMPAISGSVTIGAGTAQIGSVTASISGTVPVSGTFFQATQPVSLSAVPTHGVTLTSTTVTVSSMPAISGTVTANLSNVVTNDQFNAVPAVRVMGTGNDGIILAGIDDSGNPANIYEGGLLPISGTVTANLIKPTWTNYSGTVVTANTAVTAISNTSRSYLLAQVTTGQMFLNIGATATSLNSVYFSAGQGFAWETVVPQGIVSIISAVTGTNYVLKEG